MTATSIYHLWAYAIPAFFSSSKMASPFLLQDLCKDLSLCMECLFLPAYTPWLISTHLSGVSLNVTPLKWLFWNTPPPNQVYVSTVTFFFIVLLGGY